MRKFKILSLSILLISTSLLIQSCSEESCDGITCEFDGVCDNGECSCTEVTTNYLVGTWEMESDGSLVGTFNSDNTFSDSFGNVVDWAFDSSTNTITVTPGNMVIIKESGFSCSQMNVTIDSGSTQTDFTFIRR